MESESVIESVKERVVVEVRASASDVVSESEILRFCTRGDVSVSEAVRVSVALRARVFC